MNNEEIRVVRNKYNSLKEKNKESFNENELIHQTFGLIPNTTTSSNRILVYMGAYKTNEILGIRLTELKDSDYVMYKDLETCESLILEKPYSLLKFSKHDKLISLNDDKFESVSDYLIAFRQLRNQLLKELLVKPQEEVVKQIVKEKAISVNKLIYTIR